MGFRIAHLVYGARAQVFIHETIVSHQVSADAGIICYVVGAGHFIIRKYRSGLFTVMAPGRMEGIRAAIEFPGFAMGQPVGGDPPQKQSVIVLPIAAAILQVAGEIGIYEVVPRTGISLSELQKVAGGQPAFEKVAGRGVRVEGPASVHGFYDPAIQVLLPAEKRIISIILRLYAEI